MSDKFMRAGRKLIIGVSIAPFLAGFHFCHDAAPIAISKIEQKPLVYLNHSDTARYVGMSTCRLCHQDIYATFIKTGMGKSLGLATRSKSAGDFSSASVYDKFADLHYHAYWNHDSMFIKEFRLDKKDTTFSRTEQVSFIIGSGQHTNSHLQSVNGYVNQMPMTFYTQKQKWDLPPGFQEGLNTRFSRKIGLECMSCHNAYPEFVEGSENKYNSIPTGIDCERCHGPGSIHVAQRQSGSRIDTSKYIDPSIVNPAKLSIDAQFDICQRCHLQGNAVLKDKKSFYDFRPGQKLSDFISVFLPKYKNADDQFIMASHADRLKQSACFIKSYEKAGNKNPLKPYQGAMTCVTCHNPHVSVRETNKEVFNDACRSCHGKPDLRTCSDKKVVAIMHKTSDLNSQKINCVSCHMPISGSIDIPHVSVHDHYIRKPITQHEKDKIKTFVGLFSVNEKKPDGLTRAKAYINQYDKFDADPRYLDSALHLLSADKDPEQAVYALIQLYFIKQDFAKVLACVNKLNAQRCYDSLFVNKSYDNQDAWACYRVAEAYSNSLDATTALRWFKKATQLAPYNLDFRNKLGSSLAALDNLEEASAEFKFILSENPNSISAYSNLGYIKLKQGFTLEAFQLYMKGKKLDPDNEPLLLNLAGYYLYNRDISNAKIYLNRILKRNPASQRAKQILRQLNTSQ